MATLRMATVLALGHFLLSAGIDAEGCDLLNGVNVFDKKYNRGSCYFISTAGILAGDIQTVCNNIYPGSVGAIFPDFSIVNELFKNDVSKREVYPEFVKMKMIHNYSVTEFSTFVRERIVLRFMALYCPDTPRSWNVCGGWRPATSAGVKIGWVWKIPDGDDIAISESEMTQRWTNDPTTSAPENHMILYSHKSFYGYADIAPYNTYFGALCQIRVKQITFATVDGQLGVGAVFATPSVKNHFHCGQRCAVRFACLAASWSASDSICSLHYVSSDYKMNLTTTSDVRDKFYRVID